MPGTVGSQEGWVPLPSFQNKRCHSDTPTHTVATVPSMFIVPATTWGLGRQELSPSHCPLNK